MGLLVLFLLINFNLWGQKSGASKKTKVEVLSLDKLSYKELDGKKVRILVGNVAFKKDNVIFKCDSAIQYIEDQKIFAYQNVRFNQGDSIRLKGDHLVYDERTEKVKITGKKVSMTDGKMRLESTALYYDMLNNIAYYTDSAYIQDAENKLYSQKGYYYSDTKDMYFKTRVKLINKDSKVETDTLRYNIQSEKSHFIGPSHIWMTEGPYIYCENGIFNSKSNNVRLGKRSYLEDKGQTLKGDSLYYNGVNGIGYAYKRVEMVDTTKGLKIAGNFARYDRKQDAYLVSDSVLMRQVDGRDTLYLSSDTLILNYDTTHQQRMAFAYHHVKVFSQKYQASCDSMVFYQKDSIIDYFGKPIFWMDSFQITSEQIRSKLGKSGIEKVNLNNIALIGQRHRNGQFDQIAGDSMTAYFKNGKIKKVEVHSSAKAIYYLLEGDTALLGANNVNSHKALIRFDSEGLSKFSFIDQVESIITPAKEVNPLSLLLPGFKWNGVLRPYKKEQVFPKSGSKIIMKDNK